MTVSKLIYLSLFQYVRLPVFVQIVAVSMFSFYSKLLMAEVLMLCREMQSWTHSRSSRNWGYTMWRKTHTHRMMGNRDKVDTGHPTVVRNILMIGLSNAAQDLNYFLPGENNRQLSGIKCTTL